MATVTKRDISNSTANVATYPSNSFTPPAGELLAVIVHCTGSVATDSTLTASANGMTFSVVGAPLVHTLSGNVSYVFVSDQLVPSSPAAMTVSFNLTVAGTGAYIAVAGVSGMTKVGTAAILQTAFSPNLGANAAYTATFAAAVNTANPILGFVGWAGTITITAPPTGMTEIDQPAQQVTPTQGFEWAKSDSGLTATAYTWTASAATVRANVGAIEFDTSGGGGGGGPTIDFEEDFELGGDGTTPEPFATTNFTNQTAYADAQSHSSLHSILGTKSLRILNPTGTTYLYNTFSPAKAVLYQRVYFYMADWTEGTTVMGVYTGTSIQSNVQVPATVSKFRLRDGTTITATSTMTPAVGQWYRLELKTDYSAGTHALRIFTGANLHGTTADEELSGSLGGGGVGGHLQLEDASGNIQLEDASGALVTEDYVAGVTTFDRVALGTNAANVLDWFMDTYAYAQDTWVGPADTGTPPTFVDTSKFFLVL